MEKREQLALYSCMYKGSWNLIAAAIKNELPARETEIRDRYITIFDEEYPPLLKQLRFPPWVLFYRGDLSLLKEKPVTIVGSRRISEYGQKVTETVAAVLAETHVLVSGLAKGADGIVHRTALERGKKTIGVIGSGLDRRYPAANADLYKRMEKDGLILSEFPAGAEIRKENFPWRNRILAALSPRIIVTQAALRSGTMHTVNEALQLDREIWCVPYPFADAAGAGCDLMIQQGANILYDPEQLVDFS